jgi:hypothetical protein
MRRTADSARITYGLPKKRENRAGTPANCKTSGKRLISSITAANTRNADINAGLIWDWFFTHLL